MLQQVSILIESNRLQEAKSLCERLSKNNKKNPEVWLLMADINNRLGALKDAKLNYKKAIKLKPNHSLAHARLGMLFHSQEIYSKAEQSYQFSLKLDNQQPAIHYNLGVVYQELGKLDKAETEYRQAIQGRPNYVKALANLAYVLRQHGNLDESLEHYQQAIRLEPEIAELHYNIGLTLLQLGDAEKAEKHQQESIRIDPEYSDGWFGLAAVHYFNGNSSQACLDYQKSLKINPQNIDALCGYAAALSELGKHEEALQKIDAALKAEPDNFEALIQQAVIFGALGETDAALDCCDKVFKVSPDNEQAASVVANMHEIRGDAQRAFDYIEPFLNNDKPSISVGLCYSTIAEKIGRVDDATHYLHNMLLQKNTNTNDACKIHFALGRIYDKAGDYAKAFTHYKMGNDLVQPHFSISHFRESLNREMQVFSNGFTKDMPTSTEQSGRPIFIVGMPRSGTSLVEQIIASHSTVFGAGELMQITRLSETLPGRLNTNLKYPECLSVTNERTMTDLSHAYLDHISELNSGAKHVTDKLPGNYMNLGLIQQLFPNSKIIHCNRNPFDTCLSCYFQNFSRNIPWSYQLADLGQVYNEYTRMMEHWKNVLDIPIMNVNYESLTTNQEETTRDILQFLNLEWEDQCLEFHKNKRLVWTASYNQVRNAMYKKSVERWKNYEVYIEPLITTISNN